MHWKRATQPSRRTGRRRSARKGLTSSSPPLTAHTKEATSRLEPGGGLSYSRGRPARITASRAGKCPAADRPGSGSAADGPQVVPPRRRVPPGHPPGPLVLTAKLVGRPELEAVRGAGGEGSPEEGQLGTARFRALGLVQDRPGLAQDRLSPGIRCHAPRSCLRPPAGTSSGSAA